MAWGNEVWVGSTAWNTYIEWRITDYGEYSAYVQVKYSSYVKQGNLNGTVMNRSWGGQYRLYGQGWYGDSGWQNVGWVNYGQSVYRECSAWYTGYSGTYYKSSCGSSFSPTAPVWQPKVPSNAKAVRNSQTQNTVTWTNNTTTARPYDGIYVDRQVDGGDWSNLATIGGNRTSYVDETTRPNHTYRYRIGAYNSNSTAGNHSYTETLRNPPTAPTAPTAVTNARNSDSKNTVSWKNTVTGEAPYSAVKVERSIDGGAFAEIASLGGTAASYVDSTCSADHSYRYHVRGMNESGYSGYATSGTTYNTPSAPGKPSGHRTGDTSVELSIPNEARTATATEVQRSKDKATWQTIATTTGKATSYGDNPGGGTFYYRARNTRGSLVSAWSESSEAVVTICAPAAPTLLAPTSGQVLKVSDSAIAFCWKHNPIDGSAQTAAQLQYSTDAKNWTTVQLTTAQSASVANSFALNATVYWRVRTKGVHADYGPWSGNRAFYVRQPPQLAFQSPESVVRNVPISVAIQYVDASGRLADMQLQVTDRSGSVLYERAMGTSVSAEIAKEQWMPDDGGEYRLVATARSTSGLQTVQSFDFAVSFELPKRASLRVESDIERGYAELKCIVDEAGEGQAVVGMTVWRVANGVETLLGTDLMDGATLIDKYAPLNREYSYRVAAYALSGAAKTTTHPGSIKTPYSFFYFGDSMARGMFEPKESRSLKRAGRTLKRYIGRTLPVLYDSGGIEDNRSWSARIIGEEEVSAFDDLMQWPKCIFKSVAGDVFHAAVDVDIDPVLELPGHHADVSISIQHVDGEQL